MNKSTPNETHPLVAAYLTDLEHALTSTDPQERVDTLASVREHIADSLADGDGSTDQVTSVLDALGPVERIAAASTVRVDLQAPDAAPRSRAGVLVLTAALCTALLLIVNFIVAFFAAGLTATAAVVCLRARRGPRSPLLVAGLGIAVATMVLALVAALTLVTVGTSTSTSTPPLAESPH